MIKINNIYYIYTDGSALGCTPYYFGGWAAIIFKNGIKEENIIDIISGNGYPMTNNKAELTAILKAVLFAKQEYRKNNTNKFIIYSDSQYSINCVTKWCHGWKNNNWLNSSNKEVANKELVEQIMNELNFTNNFIEIKKVKGHSNDFGNEMADSEATRQSAIIKSEKGEENNERKDY